MSRIVVAVCCAAALLAATGCRRAGKAALKQAAKLARRSKPAAEEIPARNLLRKPPLPKARPHLPAPRPAVAASVSRRLPGMLGASRALGAYLKSRQARIPAHVYARLWSQWLQNDAELKSLQRQLSEPGLAPDRRARLEAQAAERENKNAEIERLAREYG